MEDQAKAQAGLAQIFEEKGATTEIIDPHEAPPTRRSPKTVMIETIECLEEVKKKAN